MKNGRLSWAHLFPGQYVKVSGKALNGSGFVAVEIAETAPRDTVKIKSQLQDIDHQKRQVHLLDKAIQCDQVHSIENIRGELMEFSSLRTGEMVKMVGQFHREGGFRPHRIQCRETLEFNIEEIEGRISRVDPNNRTVSLNGITCTVNDNTILIREY